jgi:putative ABC transport system permease protein
VALVVGVGLYVSSLDHLRTNKAAHGFAWDAAIGNVNFEFSDQARAALTGDRRFSSIGEARYGDASIDGESTEVLAYDRSAGNIAPTIISGRAPRAPGEIALGARLMDRLHKHVGDTVRFSIAGTELANLASSPTGAPPTTDADLTIVGTTLLPPGFGEADLADSATLTTDALTNLGAPNGAQLFLVRFEPGIDQQHAVAELRRQYPLWMTTDDVPSKVGTLWAGRVLPIIGAGVLALLGAVLLAYALATTARLMRGQLAVLRALGMRPHGIRNAVVWQGLLVAGLALLIGIPAGVLVGLVGWRNIADQLGVGSQPTYSPMLLAVIPLTAGFAILAAALPARSARRANVAEALRAE